MNYNNVSHDSLNEKLVSFRFFLASSMSKMLSITIFLTIFLSACDDSSLISTYRNPDITIYCNKRSTTQEYIECARKALVEKENNLSPKVKKNLHDNYFFFRDFTIPNYEVVANKIDKFSNIKECYLKNECFLREQSPYVLVEKYDEWKGNLFHTDVFSAIKMKNKNNRCDVGNSARGITRRYLYMNNENAPTDVIAASEKGELFLMSPAISTIKINENKLMIQYRITKMYSKKTVKEEIKCPFYFYENEIYEFYDIIDIQKDLNLENISNLNKILNLSKINISLDKRENPSKVFIKFLNNNYEFDIP